MTSSFRLHLSPVCEKRARLPRATRASKYWLLFESVIRCLRTPRVFPPRISTFPVHPLLLHPPPLVCHRRRYSIPHAGCVSLIHVAILSVCSLYFWLGLWEIRRFRRPGSTHLSREKSDAIYCTGVSVARKSTAIKDPRARVYSPTRYL